MNELDIEAVAEALRAGRLVLRPISEDGKFKFWALVPSGQAAQQADDRFPPTVTDPRRTNPL